MQNSNIKNIDLTKINKKYNFFLTKNLLVTVYITNKIILKNTTNNI